MKKYLLLAFLVFIVLGCVGNDFSSQYSTLRSFTQKHGGSLDEIFPPSENLNAYKQDLTIFSQNLKQNQGENQASILLTGSYINAAEAFKEFDSARKLTEKYGASVDCDYVKQLKDHFIKTKNSSQASLTKYKLFKEKYSDYYSEISEETDLEPVLETYISASSFALESLENIC